MTTALLSQNVQLRKRMREMEDEIAFLREQNYRIHKMSDTYRGKVSQLVAAIYFKDHPDSRLAFETEEELEEVVKRLRSHDITRTPPRVPEAHLMGENLPKKLSSREGDDGLMQSTSSISHATEEEGEQRVKKQHESVSRKKKCTPMGRPASAAENAAAQKAQRSAITRLMSENKNLASLVDTLRLRVSAAARLNASLEKKFRLLLSSMLDSQSSTAKRSYDNAEDKAFRSSPIQKRLRELQMENDRLRAAADHGEYLLQEASHYKTLLERQTAETEACRKRELSSIEEMDGIKMDLAKATKAIEELRTALRLSRIREKRAASSRERSQQQREEADEQCTSLASAMDCLASNMVQHHCLMGEHLLAMCVARLALTGECIIEEGKWKGSSCKNDPVAGEMESLAGAVSRLVNKVRRIERMGPSLCDDHPLIPPPLERGSGGTSAREGEDDDEEWMNAGVDTKIPEGTRPLGGTLSEDDDGQFV